MTDAEIIKALECCKTGNLYDCISCPRNNEEKGLTALTCIYKLMEDSFDLIKRQQAKIEKLEHIREKQAEKIVALKIAERNNNDR